MTCTPSEAARPVRHWAMRDQVTTDYGFPATADGMRQFCRAVRAPSSATAVRRRFLAKFPDVAMVPPVFDVHDGRVDPEAFVHASKVLARRHGERDMASGRRGGWDSVGHWGVNGHAVRAAWYASGCRCSRKFEALLLLGGASDPASELRSRRCKGLSLRQVQDAAARALRRTSAGQCGSLLSTRLLCALGRLCPELQRVALSTLPERLPSRRRLYRIADVDWSKVSEVQAQFAVDPQLRAAWSAGKRQQTLAGGRSGESLARWLGSPGLTPKEAARLIREDMFRALVALVLEAERL